MNEIILIANITAAHRAIINEWIENSKEKPMFGELNPDFGDPKNIAEHHNNILTIKEDNICIKFFNAEIVNNNLIAEVDFIGPKAKLARDLCNSNEHVFCPRGFIITRGLQQKDIIVTFDVFNSSKDITAPNHFSTLLSKLARTNISSTYLERVLELPTGTVERWKTGNINPEEMSLLKIITTYPWIIEVADGNYDKTLADSKVVSEALHITQEKLQNDLLKTMHSK